MNVTEHPSESHSIPETMMMGGARPPILQRPTGWRLAPWADPLIVFAGLCLVVIGGWFLYGVLEAERADTQAYLEYSTFWHSRKVEEGIRGGVFNWESKTAASKNAFMAGAGICFASGAACLLLGLRGLFRARSQQPPHERR